jgi:hypothetical protein
MNSSEPHGVFQWSIGVREWGQSTRSSMLRASRLSEKTLNHFGFTDLSPSFLRPSSLLTARSS